MRNIKDPLSQVQVSRKDDVVRLASLHCVYLSYIDVSQGRKDLNQKLKKANRKKWEMLKYFDFLFCTPPLSWSNQSFLQMFFTRSQARSNFVSQLSKVDFGHDLIRSIRNLPLSLHQKVLLRQLKKRGSGSDGWKNLKKAGMFVIQN